MAAALGCGLAALRAGVDRFGVRAEALAAFLGGFLADFADDLRAVLRAAGRAALFFLACFFAFLAVR
ncbi:MAG TPA: hypothetical protein VFV51_11285, partial [Vicinamibacterales bacterium]|nr:hypothetical protein [Vicinamibacterales bacterium]